MTAKAIRGERKCFTYTMKIDAQAEDKRSGEMRAYHGKIQISEWKS